jgi:hypothetical protein
MAKLNRMMGSPLAAVMAAASAPAAVNADADAGGSASSAASSVVGAVVTPLFEKPKAPGRSRTARLNVDDADQARDQAQDKARAEEDALAEAEAKAALDIAEREASSAAEAASLAAVASISPHALVAEKSGAKKSAAEKSGAKVSGRKSVMGAKNHLAKDVWATDFETVFHGGRVAVQDADRAFFALKREWRYHYAVLLGNSLMLFSHTYVVFDDPSK